MLEKIQKKYLATFNIFNEHTKNDKYMLLNTISEMQIVVCAYVFFLIFWLFVMVARFVCV